MKAAAHEDAILRRLDVGTLTRAQACELLGIGTKRTEVILDGLRRRGLIDILRRGPAPGIWCLKHQLDDLKAEHREARKFAKQATGPDASEPRQFRVMAGERPLPETSGARSVFELAR